MDTQKLEAKGCPTVGGQPAYFFEHVEKSGKERSTYTLLHKTDVLSYKLGTEDSQNCNAVIDSFRILNCLLCLYSAAGKARLQSPPPVERIPRFRD